MTKADIVNEIGFCGSKSGRDIDKAKEIAKTLNAEYLRLFVVDINIPAIQLYTKKEFVKVNGVYNEIFDDGFVLHEHGYEIKL